MRLAPALLAAHAGPAPPRRWPSGIASLDAALGGGIALGRVHEVYAGDEGDAGAARGWAAALAIGSSGLAGPILWACCARAARQAGVFQASGWAELGGAPGDVILAEAPDAMALLRTAADALRGPALGAVVMEAWGKLREMDLTASRRLALAAEKSGVPLFLLRMEAQPVPSAAQTRWEVAAAPSLALPGNAPGGPTFDITLLRQRSGPCGLDWRVEWNRDRRNFNEPAIPGAVVSVPVRGPAAEAAAGIRRPWARSAA